LAKNETEESSNDQRKLEETFAKEDLSAIGSEPANKDALRLPTARCCSKIGATLGMGRLAGETKLHSPSQSDDRKFTGKINGSGQTK